MRKVMLSLVFVLGATTMVNAENSIETTATTDCIQLAFDTEALLGFELPYKIFDAIVSSCEAQQ